MKSSGTQHSWCLPYWSFGTHGNGLTVRFSPASSALGQAALHDLVNRSKMEMTMRTSSKTLEAHDRKATLSTLWIFLVANYIYCDVFSHMEPAVIKELITGTVGSIPVTQESFC